MKNSLCYIVQEYYPKDTRVRKYVNLAVSSGYLADVICLRRGDDLKFESHEGYNIYRIGLPKKRGGLVRYLLEYSVFFFLAMLLVTRLNFKRKYKVIHINTLPDFLVFCAFIPKLFGSKVILDMHEITPEFYMMKYNMSGDRPVIKILKLIEKASLRYADSSITVTEKIKQLFVKRNGLKRDMDVILNVPENSTGYVKKDFDFKKRFNIVYHGTITPVYNIVEVIDSIAKIRTKVPNLLYHIYGEGEESDALKQRAKELGIDDIVIFHGFLKHADMMKELENMDLGILPWKRSILSDISFSNKIAEYTGLGIPVISSHLPSLDDYFGNDSIFYTDERENSLPELILHVYSNQEEAARKSKNAYDDLKKIRWEIMSEVYLNRIKKLINK
jgi:glycosyltransferase involved in cell wall biosynthesis